MLEVVMNDFTKIGIIKNRFDESEDPAVIRAEESVIEIFKEFLEGLFRIEDSGTIDVLFLFDRSKGFNLKGPVFSGEIKGVFASRSPNRPTPVGLSTVKLVKRENNQLIVKGLDALNGSPVIDIKPSDKITAIDDLEVIRYNNLRANPRSEINELVKESALEKLLVMAAQIHGHYCPGLALGVIAGTGGIQKMGVDSDGLEDLLAIVETNNCFSDGIQFVTGCSFGNNALIFKDTGKIACMLVNRKGQGFRMVLKPDARDQMHVVYPGFADTFNKVVAKGERDSSTIDTFKSEGRTKAFTVLRLDFEKLFTVEPVRNIKVPDYAPSHESFTCTACGESTMETRGRVKDDGKYCLECAGEKVNRLTGSGINIE